MVAQLPPHAQPLHTFKIKSLHWQKSSYNIEMDQRIEPIYSAFKDICTQQHSVFTEEEFKNRLTHELTTNPRVKNRDSIETALNYLLNDEKLTTENVASFIHKTLAHNKKNNQPITDFKFDNAKQCCIAPYSTINFDAQGTMRVCCYNNKFLLGTYPSVTIEQAWRSEAREQFIEKIKKLDFSNGCDKCRMQIVTKNISNALFTKFNQFESIIGDDPVNFEFDFGTICNYECIMCGGRWSSSIRKNREKLPPIKTPYDDAFVDQLKQYIPSMRIANFLGGEPFLTPLYYKIWDLIYEYNPNLPIYITSNGSILNNRIKEYVVKLPNARITISLDSLKKETYEVIRKNSNFDQVMSNIKELITLNKLTSIAFCPLIQNVYELPDIANFCIEHNLTLAINTVTNALGGSIKGIHANEKHNTVVWAGLGSPNLETFHGTNPELIPEFCLHTLPHLELTKIISHLRQYSFHGNPDIHDRYASFINSLVSINIQK